jgi:hypothetical protein
MTVLYDDIYTVKDIVKNARYDARIRICTQDKSGEYTAVYDGKVYGLYDDMNKPYCGKNDNNIVYKKIEKLHISYDGIFISI